MSKHEPKRLGLTAFVTFGLLLCAAPRAGRADPKEWSLTVTPHFSYARARDHDRAGAGLALTSGYRLVGDGFLEATVSYSGHGPSGEYDGAMHVGMLSASFVYQWTAGAWLPSLRLGAGAAVLGGVGMDTKVEADLHAGGCLDYLLGREWAVGLELTYHLFVPDAGDFPAMLRVGLRLTRRFY